MYSGLLGHVQYAITVRLHMLQMRPSINTYIYTRQLAIRTYWRSIIWFSNCL